METNIILNILRRINRYCDKWCFFLHYVNWIFDSWLFQLISKSKSNILSKKIIALSQYCLQKLLVWRGPNHWQAREIRVFLLEGHLHRVLDHSIYQLSISVSLKKYQSVWIMFLETFQEIIWPLNVFSFYQILKSICVILEIFEFLLVF